MTDTEASAEAHRRWGPNARAVHYPRGTGPRFMVGIIAPLAVPIWREAWSGNTWEEAFAAADAASLIKSVRFGPQGARGA